MRKELKKKFQRCGANKQSDQMDYPKSDNYIDAKLVGPVFFFIILQSDKKQQQLHVENIQIYMKNDRAQHSTAQTYQC